MTRVKLRSHGEVYDFTLGARKASPHTFDLVGPHGVVSEVEFFMCTLWPEEADRGQKGFTINQAFKTLGEASDWLDTLEGDITHLELYNPKGRH